MWERRGKMFATDHFPPPPREIFSGQTSQQTFNATASLFTFTLLTPLAARVCAQALLLLPPFSSLPHSPVRTITATPVSPSPYVACI